MNIHEDEDQILKKKQKKIDKHFSILIDARKHKILSYTIVIWIFGKVLLLKAKLNYVT